MKGKVFESSMDVYQDQAKVLFDFYLNAAQKIIDQEDEFDKMCDELDSEVVSINERAAHINRDYIISGVLVALGVILLLVQPIIGAIFIVGGGAFFIRLLALKKISKESWMR